MHVLSKANAGGVMVKLHSGEWWLSPQRDLALSMPEYIRQALTLAAESDSEVCKRHREFYGTDDIARLAKSLAHYVEKAHTLDDERPKDAQQAFEDAGLDQVYPTTWEVFGYCMACVVMTAYWYGSEESARRQPIPYLGEAYPIIDPDDPKQRRKPHIFVTRWLRKILRLKPRGLKSPLSLKLDS